MRRAVVTSLPSALVQVKAGRLKPLGVAGEKRSTFAPELPTVKEGGVPYVVELWWGLAAPGKTPPEIVDKLSDTLRKAMQSPQLKQRYATEGAEAVPMSPQEFTNRALRCDQTAGSRGARGDAGLSRVPRGRHVARSRLLAMTSLCHCEDGRTKQPRGTRKTAANSP